MAGKNAIEKIISQDDLPIIVISQMLHKTEIKGHHVYKDVWSPEMGEELEVHCEPDNVVDKYAICLKTKDGKIVGHLKKGKSGRFAKTIYYFYEVTLKQAVQPKYLVKDSILEMARVYKCPAF